MKQNLTFLLTEEAEIDLDSIFEYSKITYSEKQAVIYLNKIEKTLIRLSKNLNLGKEKNEIRLGLFSITESEHIIFYRIIEQKIRVIRIIHGSKDLPNEF